MIDLVMYQKCVRKSAAWLTRGTIWIGDNIPWNWAREVIVYAVAILHEWNVFRYTYKYGFNPAQFDSDVIRRYGKMINKELDLGV